MLTLPCFFFFFFNDTATTEIYTLSLHDALPISNFARPVRGAPLPQERPYDLGERNDRVAMESYPQLRSTSDARVMASEALARHPINRRVADVSPDTEAPRYMAARLRAAEAREEVSAEVTAARNGP